MMTEFETGYRPEEFAGAQALVGRTVARVELPTSSDRHDMVIHFTDGSCLGLRATGYDAESIIGEITESATPAGCP
jgi:hypothetical protein